MNYWWSKKKYNWLFELINRSCKNNFCKAFSYVTSPYVKISQNHRKCIRCKKFLLVQLLYWGFRGPPPLTDQETHRTCGPLMAFLCYTGRIQSKIRGNTEQKKGGKMYGWSLEETGCQLQVSSPVGSHGTHLISPAMSSRQQIKKLSTREAH